MTIVATLLVRDEADVVDFTIRHHLGQGVDFIIAMDNGSQDGTLEILKKYEATGVLELHLQPDQDYRQSEWVTFMARRAASAHGAHWVLNIDADEFWIPKNRRLTLAQALSLVPSDVGKISAMRTDLEGFPGRDDQHWLDRLHWRNRRTVSERGTPLAPKVCHRGDPDVTVPQGNHDAHGPLLDKMMKTMPLDIYHVPRRSWEQFRSKIDNGGSSYAANKDLGPNVGWHWRADYERLLDGSLEDTYRRRCLTPWKLIRGVLLGRLVFDKRLAASLRSLDDSDTQPS
jgi:glycosyltransferase involved in cell wall biosynthesis